MAQYNIFGELEEDIRSGPVVIDEPPEPPPLILHKRKKRKGFEINVCRNCSQLLLHDPENTRINLDDELCPACDDRLKAQFDKYKNFALIRALRLHKR